MKKIDLLSLIEKKCDIESADLFFNQNLEVMQIEIIHDSTIIAVIQFSENLDAQNMIMEENIFKVHGYTSCHSENIYIRPTEQELINAIDEIIKDYKRIYS